MNVKCSKNCDFEKIKEILVKNEFYTQEKVNTIKKIPRSTYQKLQQYEDIKGIPVEILNYCLRNGFKEIPTCPYCGKPRAFCTARYFFENTCGDKSCESIRRANTTIIQHKKCSKEVSQNIGKKISITRKQNILEKNSYKLTNILENNFTTFDTFREVLLKNKIIVVHSTREHVNYRLNTVYGYVCLSRLIALDSRILEFSKEFETLESFAHGLCHGYLSGPKCVICGKPVHFFAGAGTYSKTCSDPRCIRSLQSRKYEYEGISFDSSPEVAYYIWCKDYNKNIIREPLALEYTTIDGEKHLYFPDFSVDDQLVEIKGKNLINEEGFLINKKTKEIQKEKTLCMRENNIKLIITDGTINDPYVRYVREKYGKNYLKSLKIVKKK